MKTYNYNQGNKKLAPCLSLEQFGDPLHQFVPSMTAFLRTVLLRGADKIEPHRVHRNHVQIHQS